MSYVGVKRVGENKKSHRRKAPKPREKVAEVLTIPRGPPVVVVTAPPDPRQNENQSVVPGPGVNSEALGLDPSVGDRQKSMSDALLYVRPKVDGRQPFRSYAKKGKGLDLEHIRHAPIPNLTPASLLAADPQTRIPLGVLGAGFIPKSIKRPRRQDKAAWRSYRDTIAVKAKELGVPLHLHKRNGFQYLSLSLQQLFQVHKETRLPERNLCALIRPGYPVAGYDDLDMPLVGVTTLDEVYVVRDLVVSAYRAMFCAYFQQIYNRPPRLGRDKEYWFDATILTKISLHPHFIHEAWATLGDYKRFSSGFVAFLTKQRAAGDLYAKQLFYEKKGVYSCIVDQSVKSKNSLLRLAYNRKPWPLASTRRRALKPLSVRVPVERTVGGVETGERGADEELSVPQSEDEALFISLPTYCITCPIGASDLLRVPERHQTANTRRCGGRKKRPVERRNGDKGDDPELLRQIEDCLRVAGENGEVTLGSGKSGMYRVSTADKCLFGKEHKNNGAYVATNQDNTGVKYRCYSQRCSGEMMDLRFRGNKPKANTPSTVHNDVSEPHQQEQARRSQQALVPQPKKQRTSRAQEPIIFFAVDGVLGSFQPNQQFKVRPGSKAQIRRITAAGIQVGVWMTASESWKLEHIKKIASWSKVLTKDNCLEQPSGHRMKPISAQCWEHAPNVRLIDDNPTRIPECDQPLVIQVPSWKPSYGNDGQLKKAVSKALLELTRAQPGAGEKMAEMGNNPNDDLPQVTVAMKYDLANLEQIHLLELSCELQRQGDKLYEAFFGKESGTPTTLYTVFEADMDFREGRLYGRDFEPTRIQGWMSRFLTYRYYHHTYIHNAAPTLILQIYTSCYGANAVPEVFREYATNRSTFFARLRAEEPKLVACTKKQLSTACVKIYHGLKHTSHYKQVFDIDLGDDPLAGGDPVPLLVRLEDEISEMETKLSTHPDYVDMYQDVIKKTGKSRIPRSFIARVWQVPENEIICLLMEYYKKHTSHAPGSLEFDGLKVARLRQGAEYDPDVRVDPVILRKGEAYIKERHPNHFEVKLAEEDLNPTLADYDKFYGPKAINRIRTPLEKAIYFIERDGQVKRARRLEGYGMLPHKTIPGVYVRDAEAKEFIGDALISTGVQAPMNKLTEWFDCFPSARFPLLTRKKIANNIISFTDGFLDINKMVGTQFRTAFTLWEGFEGTPPITDWYYERPMPAMDDPMLRAPLWEKMLRAQMSEEVMSVFEALIGRLCYRLRTFDNWQVMPFLLGDANTGKGTALDIVKQIFPPGSVGVLTATMEKKFGLENLYKKRLVIGPDVPRELRSLLAQTDFQSMVSGEGVSIARKNQVAVNEEDWTAPMLFAANELPNYKDNSGSISRRTVVFEFINLIKTRDTLLKTKILKDEKVNILIRCLVRYMKLREEIGGKDFWKCMPDELQRVQADVKEASNPLAEFLANGSDYYQVLHKKGEITTLTALDTAYGAWMKFSQQKPGEKIGNDRHPIKAAGFVLEQQNLCKVCDQKLSKTNCGGHYNPQNRRKKWVIKDCLLRKLNDDGGELQARRELPPIVWPNGVGRGDKEPTDDAVDSSTPSQPKAKNAQSYMYGINWYADRQQGCTHYFMNKAKKVYGVVNQGDVHRIEKTSLWGHFRASLKKISA